MAAPSQLKYLRVKCWLFENGATRQLVSCMKVRHNVFGHINDKSTPSRPLGEVKLVRARLVVRWVTTCEARVLKAYHFYRVLHTSCFRSRLTLITNHIHHWSLIVIYGSTKPAEISQGEMLTFRKWSDSTACIVYESPTQCLRSYQR